MKPLTKMRGFSLLELMVVLGIVLIAGAFAFVNLQGVVKDARVSTGYNNVITTMRQGREAAITQRRIYIVTFVAPRTITVAAQKPAADAINVTATLPLDLTFNAEAGIPNTPATVPDQMGLGLTAIDFNVRVGGGGSNQIFFWPDGSARDAVGNINDGVVYIARAGELLSSRAVTLRGLTGRIRGWRLTSAGGNRKWSQM